MVVCCFFVILLNYLIKKNIGFLTTKFLSEKRIERYIKLHIVRKNFYLKQIRSYEDF